MERKTYGRVVFFTPKGNVYETCGQTRVLKSFDALNVYANTPNPASQLVYGNSEQEIEEETQKIITNMANEDYVAEYVKPYI